MRLVHWEIGVLLGAITGGSALVLGVIALLVAVPGLVWAAREPARPLGLAGLLIGLGAGVAGLFALATARCAASNSAVDGFVQSCSSPDATPYLVFALVLIVLGGALTVLGLGRARHTAA